MAEMDFPLPGEPREIAVDRVTCELMLETARSCRSLRGALARVDVEITDAGEQRVFTRRMRAIELFARTCPSILEPRRLLCLGAACAERPEWWWCNFVHFMDERLTISEIANLRGLRDHQVRDYIQNVELGMDCYDRLPEMEE